MAKDSVNKMCGDAFREIGVLIFVFALLDKIVSGTITRRWTILTMSFSTFFFLAGVLTERMRNDE
jgi:hypothetical protein